MQPQVFKISQGYRKCTLWSGNDYGERRCISTIKPTPHLMRSARYCVIINWLREKGINVDHMCYDGKALK